MRAACDWQAITGPCPTGLGMAVHCFMRALAGYAPQVQVLGLKPNKVDAPLSRVPNRIAWEQARLPLALAHAKRHGAQLSFTPALGAPLLSPLPRVAYVHDLIPLKQPKLFTGAARWYWSKLLPATWRGCQALAVSNTLVAEELTELLNYPRERIFLAPYFIEPALPVGTARLLPEEADASPSGLQNVTRYPSEPTFITVGSHEPRKNLELALHALAQLSAQQLGCRLVITGVLNAYTEVLRQLASGLKISEQVEFTGYLTQRQLIARLVTSTALIFVSREEGFGLPPLEAHSIGCPVILSDIPVLRAVHADPDRLARLAPARQLPPVFVAVDDVNALASAMARFATDVTHRTQQAQAGLAYAATFTPAETARGLVSAFESVI